MKERLKERDKNVLLTVEEASKFLNVKVSWLRQAVFRKDINHIKVGALLLLKCILKA